MIDRTEWTPPAVPKRTHRTAVPGAMGGSRLLDLPQYAEQRSRLEAFATGPGPRALEVGFDHGITLLANARAMPDWQWLGVEIRRRRVDAVQPHVPENCLAERLDARILLAGGIVDDALHRIDILFPTPARKGRHLLWTPAFVDDLAHSLAPGGVVHVATDVPALAALCGGCSHAGSGPPTRLPAPSAPAATASVAETASRWSDSPSLPDRHRSPLESTDGPTRSNPRAEVHPADHRTRTQLRSVGL